MSMARSGRWTGVAHSGRPTSRAGLWGSLERPHQQHPAGRDRV